MLRALPGHQDLLAGQGLRLPQGAQLLVVWAGQLDRCGWEASNGQVNAASTGREKEEELRASGIALGGQGPARHLMLWGSCVTWVFMLLNWSELPDPFAKPHSLEELQNHPGNRAR